MRAPSIKTLLATFRDLDSAGARLIRALSANVDDTEKLAALIEKRCPETHAYRRRCYHDPLGYSANRNWRVTMVLHAIDRVLDTCGVEPLGTVDMHDGPPYEYCNTGDTYAATLVYDRDKHRLLVSSWGDIAESDPRLQENEDS